MLAVCSSKGVEPRDRIRNSVATVPSYKLALTTLSNRPFDGQLIGAHLALELNIRATNDFLTRGLTCDGLHQKRES